MFRRFCDKVKLSLESIFVLHGRKTSRDHKRAAKIRPNLRLLRHLNGIFKQNSVEPF